MECSRLAQLLNVWMQRFIDKPDDFCREWETVLTHLKECDADKEPSYGTTCVAYLQKLDAEVPN